MRFHFLTPDFRNNPEISSTFTAMGMPNPKDSRKAYLLVSSANILCKQFEPRSGLTKYTA